MTGGSTRRGAGRGARLVAITTPLVGAVCGFGSSVLLARVFGADGRGEYAVAIASIMAVAQVLSLGLGESLAIAESRQTLPARPRLIVMTIWVALAIGGCVWIAIAPTTVYAVVGAVLTTFLLQISSYALAAHQIRRWAFAQLIQPFAVLAATAVAALQDLPIELVLWTYAASPLAGALLCLPAIPGRNAEQVSMRAALRSILVVGLARQLTVTLLSLVRRIDVIALAATASLSAVGQYAVAMSLVDLCLLAPWALAGMVLGDELRGDVSTPRQLVIRLGTLTMVPVLAVAATGWFLIPWVWGADFSTSYLIFLLVVPGTLALGSIRALLSKRAAAGQQAAMAIRFAVLLIPSALLIWLGAAQWAAIGAAVATSVAFIMYLLAAYISPRRRDSDASTLGTP